MSLTPYREDSTSARYPNVHVEIGKDVKRHHHIKFLILSAMSAGDVPVEARCEFVDTVRYAPTKAEILKVAQQWVTVEEK